MHTRKTRGARKGLTHTTRARTGGWRRRSGVPWSIEQSTKRGPQELAEVNATSIARPRATKPAAAATTTLAEATK
jgi:hypothetical protein